MLSAIAKRLRQQWPAMADDDYSTKWDLGKKVSCDIYDAEIFFSITVTFVNSSSIVLGQKVFVFHSKGMTGIVESALGKKRKYRKKGGKLAFF